MTPRTRDPRWHALTLLGIGHARPAPGTWGSLPPVAAAAALILLGLGPAEAPILYNLAVATMLIAASAACAAFGEWAEAWFGKKDPGWVVADEAAGQSIALFALPVAAPADWSFTQLWPVAFALASAFLAFRLFDIAKPPPARALQKIPGGWGILIDDLFAGVYALVLTHLLCALIIP